MICLNFHLSDCIVRLISCFMRNIRFVLNDDSELMEQSEYLPCKLNTFDTSNDIRSVHILVGNVDNKSFQI